MGCCSRTLAANRASLVETCLPGPWAGAAPSPPLGPQPSPAGVPGRPRPQCPSQPLVRCLQGIKKPYNPILGETFRCCWFHPQTNSHTFYIAEQARATPVGGHWWRVGSVSARACFWAAPPWTAIWKCFEIISEKALYKHILKFQTKCMAYMVKKKSLFL